MGAAKEMWMAEYERVCDEFLDDKISEDEFRASMKALGYDPHEIQEHIDELKYERGD